MFQPLVVSVLLSLVTFSEAFAPLARPGHSCHLMRSTQEDLTATATTSKEINKNGNMFFASPTEQEQRKPAVASSAKANQGKLQKVLMRELGSQENLMLPRQYGPSDVTFPQMNHVAAIQLSATPSMKHLRIAVSRAVAVHPLLRAHVQGDGEPDRRIDLFNMVREGDPQPTTFVATEAATVDESSLPISLVTTTDLELSWKNAFSRDLDDGSWCDTTEGPLWKLELHTAATTPSSDEIGNDKPCVLMWSFNHAISDQSSVNRLVDQILDHLNALDIDEEESAYKNSDMPVSLEDSVLGRDQRWKAVGPDGVSPSTAAYVAGKATEGFRNPVILPDDNVEQTKDPFGALNIIAGQTAGGTDDDAQTRQSTVTFRSLSKQTTQALVSSCRSREVSMSNALTAAVAYTASDFVGGNNNSGDEGTSTLRNYKVLQSLDMRRFGAQLDQGETVACMAGSHDLMHGPISDETGRQLRRNPTPPRLEAFWDLAREGKTQTQQFIDSNGPAEAVRVFDFAMTVADLNNLVHLTAQSKDTKGRAYSAGVTNVGVYERQKGFPRSDGSRHLLQSQHGKYSVEEIYFATPHTQSGCLFQVSALSLDGKLRLTFNPVSPIVSEEINQRFADAFVEALEIVAGAKDVTVTDRDDDKSSTRLALIKENALPLVAFGVGLASILSYAPAWADFYQSIMEMKANTSPEEFWPALNFWIFFAVGHPILQPILWISDVLHGTPGPMVGGLVPALFLAGNAAVIAAISFSRQVRNAANIAAVAAFFTYVGAGLSGSAGLGDFNLALDDSYQGQVVKGCPAYEEVRQPSMDDFDLRKYQGLWYEQKFHDWTQFKEVYDTSLDIKLTEGGDGWIDDFAVKGPAPDAAPLSWDKSPVANGAHYFLFGRVDKNDPPGILREKGFGVEFPNYIVDVKKDPATGQYKEAIQFQCLERGGVRVFEGINFMSRNPVMTDEEMSAMHARAEKAGMYPYGASPEQMHHVARRPLESPRIYNGWQQMWSDLGVDRLLELLTESIEDGGR